MGKISIFDKSIKANINFKHQHQDGHFTATIRPHARNFTCTFFCYKLFTGTLSLNWKKCWKVHQVFIIYHLLPLCIHSRAVSMMILAVAEKSSQTISRCERPTRKRMHDAVQLRCVVCAFRFGHPSSACQLRFFQCTQKHTVTYLCMVSSREKHFFK